MKYVKNKKYLPILIAVFVVVIGVLFLFRGGSAPALIGTEVNMTRLVRGSEVSPNGFFSVPFLKDSEEYTFINIAVDLNKDGIIGSYIAGGETQEEWLARNMHARVLKAEANNFPIFIPDKTIEERSDFPAYIALGKNKLSDWDGHSASGGLLKEAKISALELMDYGPYYSPDPEGIRSGGFPSDWLAPSYAFADNSIPDTPPGLGTGIRTAQTLFDVFHFGVPDLNQEINECAPTSAVNSLLWLAQKYDFSDKLPSGDGADLISELKYDMKWNDGGVVVPANFIPGINAFVSRHKIPLEVHQVGGKFDRGIVAKIAEELRKGQDVEIDLEYGIYAADGSYKRVGGHVVTVVGAWGVGGLEFLDIHDPLSPGPGTLDTYKIDGTHVVDYAFRGTTVTYIKYAFAESPKSEVKSIYEGTYEGEFNYEYNYNTKEECKGQKYEDRSGWTPAILHLRVTFESTPYTEMSSDMWYPFTVNVTKIWTDDPDFGTGADGVAPLSAGKPAKLILPMIPRTADDPRNYAVIEKSAEYPDGKKWDPLSQHGFLFFFPVGPEGDTMISAGDVGEGYYVSPDGTTFHSYPHNPGDPFLTSNTWSAQSKISSGSGPLSLNSIISGPGKKEYCGDPRFISWSLTKVSP